MAMDAVTTRMLPNRIARMDRAELVDLLSRLDCGFALDFTPEFLESVSLSRLRHIALAAARHSINLDELISQGLFGAPATGSLAAAG